MLTDNSDTRLQGKFTNAGGSLQRQMPTAVKYSVT
jgi:hypothetical protein